MSKLRKLIGIPLALAGLGLFIEEHYTYFGKDMKNYSLRDASYEVDKVFHGEMLEGDTLRYATLGLTGLVTAVVAGRYAKKEDSKKTP